MNFNFETIAMSADPHRPQYHFLPPANWMNDPNGMIQWNDQFHLFYQYNPYGAYHEKIHWGHAVSRDLVHWEHLPIALTPTRDEPDAEGCWSGCAVDDHGIPTLIYTAAYPQTVCLATSADELLTWQKYPTPIIHGPPAEIADQTGGHFRDPFIWRNGEGEFSPRWLMMMGTKLEGKGGMILLYESHDLRNWTYLHPILEGDVNETKPFWTGTMWECPNLLDFGEKQIITISGQATPTDHLFAFYFTGELRQDRFNVEGQHILVPTDYFYAPQVMRLSDGRIIMFGWVREGRSLQAAIEAGWNGMMSLPLECSMLPNGKLALAPARELQTLRANHFHFENIHPNSQLVNMERQACEILAVFEPTPNIVFGLKVRCSPDGAEETRVVFQDQHVYIDLDHTSLNPDVKRSNYHQPVEIGGKVSVRVFLDHSIIEVFVNGQYLVSRIYPSRKDSLGIDVFAEGEVKIPSVDIWEMKSI